jgi:hypothetical protein
MSAAGGPLAQPVVVLLGTNRFEGCDTLFSVAGKPMLRVQIDPLSVLLDLPKEVFPGGGITVAPGATPTESVETVDTDRSVAVFWRKQALVIATLVEPHTVHLKIDLRAAGANIYDDVEGLHVGSNVFRDNVVTASAVAISLALE